MALDHVDAAAMVSLEQVSKSVAAGLRVEALDEVWAAHIPVQVRQCLGQSQNCLGHESPGRFGKQALLPANMDSRRQYLRSRDATIRLGRIVEGAKSKYKIRTARNGAVNTLEHYRDAPEALATWWADVKEAVLDGADVRLRDCSGQGLLHWAVTLGDFKMVRELCRAGLRPDARAKPHGPNRPGISPVDMAIFGSRIEAFSFRLLRQRVAVCGHRIDL